jgi:hypothetical protein
LIIFEKSLNNFMADRLNIIDMQNIASGFGGKCLSKEYENSLGSLKWMCKRGHTWDNSYNHVREGKWCRQCLKNDLWLDKLKVIAEKNGGKCLSEIYINYGSKLKFQCAEGHNLLLAPQSVFIGHWCRECYFEKKRTKTFDKFKAIALKKGGKCLSLKYDSKNRKLKWECKKGHKWSANTMRIGQGLWCPKCLREEKCEKELKKLQILVEKKGGKCLSTIYYRIDSPLKWKCGKGHIWSTMPRIILKGGWCPKCARKEANVKRRYTIEELQGYAKKHGGKLLSKTHRGSSTPSKWQCKEGHTWLANASNVLPKNSWCRLCKMNKYKLSIEEFKKIAKERGGELISKKYINISTPLKWKCAKGHVWSTTPGLVKGGTWCKLCHYDSMRITP